MQSATSKVAIKMPSFLKKAIKKIIGPKRYYRWLTKNRIHYQLLRSGVIANREFMQYKRELKESGFITEMFSKRKMFLRQL